MADLIIGYSDDCLQPSSYDVRLHPEFLRLDPAVEVLDVRDPRPYTLRCKAEDSFLLHPGEFIIASSIEAFKFPADLVGMLNGKSSLARVGLQVESAGFFDPGFHGQATLELANMTQRPIRLYPGMKIAQMVFFRASTVAALPYGAGKLRSKYNGQSGPTACISYVD